MCQAFGVSFPAFIWGSYPKSVIEAKHLAFKELWVVDEIGEWTGNGVAVAQGTDICISPVSWGTGTPELIGGRLKTRPRHPCTPHPLQKRTRASTLAFPRESERRSVMALELKVTAVQRKFKHLKGLESRYTFRIGAVI
ncbi:MAG: hypothetical protein ACRD2O_18790, partial [Terriglobia bacterium]